MKYKFQVTDYNGGVITFEFDETTIDGLCDQFKYFLLASGFSEQTVQSYLGPYAVNCNSVTEGLDDE